MSFIWNDREAKLVDISETYDTSEYVNARKLFIKSNEVGSNSKCEVNQS